MPIALNTCIIAAHPYAKRLARPLKRLEIATVRDLLLHFPVRHDDLRSVTSIRDARRDATVVIHGQLTSIANRRSPRQRMIITEAIVRDATASIRCVWFQQPYLVQTFHPGMPVAVAGRVVMDRYGVHVANPCLERFDRASIHTGRLVPVYSLTAGITQKQLRFLVHEFLGACAQWDDPLPASVRTREGLLAYGEAIRAIHFPEDPAMLARSSERLAFQELFEHFVRVDASRRERDAARAIRIPFDEVATKSLVAALPFPLTTAQRRAAWEALLDMSGDKAGVREEVSRTISSGVRPMQRLLNGDVGSGKTVVAAIAAANVARAGYQVAYLAPTEVLAVQQARRMTEWLRPLGVTAALWTRASRWVNGEPVSLAEVRRAVRDGSVGVAIGTHAILTDTAAFHALALAIVDEQHRFGVSQRAALREKGMVEAGEARPPHLLSMTATPIPRTYALTLLGDLDVSLLDELPAGRSVTATEVVVARDRQRMEAAMERELRSGHQVFIVCPAIDAAEEGDAANVTEVFERVVRTFPECRIALLHGRMRPAEQREVMRAFVAGEALILVATTVIEVGVDCPNATVMVIEDADRFGLAQLHQLRGRVGRGSAGGRCFLVTTIAGGPSRRRLATLESTTDGFSLAEIDLRERGPGAVAGTSQSGWPEFRFSTMDPTFLRRARAAALEALAWTTTAAHLPTAHLE